MPYVSDKQRKFFNANRKKLEAQGVNVDEWNESSRGKKLPEKVESKTATLAKLAAELVVGKRKTAPVHSFMDRLVYGENELAVPQEKDLDNFRRILRYMEASRPHQLTDAKVLTGRVDPSILVNQIDKFKNQDTFLEDLVGTRDEISQLYASIPPTAMEHIPASYHPYANSVVLNERSPGVLIHELGHGVDMAQRPNESNFYRFLRWNYKPELLEEFSAWRKGRQAYQEGYAADPEKQKPDADHQEYLDNMESYNARKYPAFGTYLGGTLGSIGGAGLGIAGGLGLMAADAPRVPIGPMAVLGALLGGMTGALGGAGAGKMWASWNKDSLRQKALAQLEELKRDPAKLRKVTERLIALNQKAESKTKTKAVKKKAA